MAKKERIALVVQCTPSHGNSHSVFRLAQTIVASDKTILSSIFFYGDGAYHALLPQAEYNDEPFACDWVILNVPLAVCVASMKRRGIIETPFKVVGLGYLAALYEENDKVIVF